MLAAIPLPVSSMRRSISLLATLLLCGGVAWLASQESSGLSLARRLRGERRTKEDDSAKGGAALEGGEEGSTVSTDAEEADVTGGVEGTGFTKKDLKELGMTEKDVKKMVKAMGAKPTAKMLKAIKKMHGSKDDSMQAYISQLVIGVIFYFLVASKYPDLGQANADQNAAAAAIMQEATPCRIKGGAICLQSLCWPAAMYAKVMKSTGVANYWIALIAGVCFPCCTVFASTHCCLMDQKLGLSASKGLMYNAFEACCCSCCLIAQTTEALDAATGWESGCCTAGQKVPYTGLSQ